MSSFGKRAISLASMILLALVGVMLTSAATGSAARPPVAQPTTAPTAQVSIVHGIPGQPVDVYVNGNKTLSNLQPGTVAGPLALPAGSYNLALTKPGQPVSAAILSVNNAAVPAGANLSVVAHLDTNGKPMLTGFVNNTSPVPAGMARIVVRHVAAAPAVDVRANGTPIFTGLTNPNQDTADVAAGPVSAEVVLAGTNTVVLGPATLNLTQNTVTIVYAIGSAQQHTLAPIVQTIKLG
jgi:uncharacterized protein DUF4397